ncbi:MAG: hypothetical protein HQL84_00495 [Magnetococcales bacterium]|nr:hypothetical protein [Magnetococcales bacterium]MBF0630647.1 hypothetical protein [Magnetococcales bacterium]
MEPTLAGMTEMAFGGICQSVGQLCSLCLNFFIVQYFVWKSQWGRKKKSKKMDLFMEVMYFLRFGRHSETGSIWVDMKPKNQNRSVLARESDGVFKACSMEKQSW